MGNNFSTVSTVVCSLVASPSCDDNAVAKVAESAAATVLECSNSWPGWGGVKYLFTFGDSYSQTGFNAQGTQPTIGNPLGNPPYPGFTSCNGPNWVDFLTTTYNASTLLTYSLADGGATIDTSIVPNWKASVQSLSDQVHKRYLPNYGNKASSAPWSAENSLFAFWIGVNDVGNTYWDANTSRVDREFQVYKGLLDEIYATGARNFLFLNVPPLQRAPLTIQNKNEESVSREGDAVASWNVRLAKLSDAFRTAHPDITTTIFSTYEVFNKIIDDPGVYPQTAVLKNTDNFCNGYAVAPQSLTKPANGCKYALNEYFWVNSLHPTYPVHDATAAELSKFLNAKPPTLGKQCGFATSENYGAGERFRRRGKWRG